MGTRIPRDVGAGAILLDGPLSAKVKLAVIHRPAALGGAGDWTLPKGHVEGDETLRQAAERELREETAYAAEYMGLADATAYLQPDNTAKSVTFFFFIRRSDKPLDRELDGVDDIAWLTFDEAIERVTYQNLKDLLARVAPPGAFAAGGRRRAGWFRRLTDRIGLERLDAAISMQERELLGLRVRPLPPADESDPHLIERASRWWRGPASDLLLLARSYHSQGRVDAGWDALHSSKRFSYYELRDDELATRARVLSSEVESKLTGWRLKAARRSLGPKMTWPPRSLIAAQDVLDGHSTNVYLKLRMASRRITIAAVLLILTVFLLGVAIFSGAFKQLGVQEPFVLQDGGLFLGVLVLGTFGAMLSLSMDTAAGQFLQGRIYDFVTARFAVPFARLAIGAGAAVVSVATVQAAGATAPWAILAAVPAGFSERLVRRSVQVIETQASK